jgi:hypothetical protein
MARGVTENDGIKQSESAKEKAPKKMTASTVAVSSTTT